MKSGSADYRVLVFSPHVGFLVTVVLDIQTDCSGIVQAIQPFEIDDL